MRVVDSIHGERNMNILGAGQGQGVQRNMKIEGDPQDSSVSASKALHSFRNGDKDSSVRSSNDVCKNLADKCFLHLAVWVVLTWGPLFQGSSWGWMPDVSEE